MTRFGSHIPLVAHISEAEILQNVDATSSIRSFLQLFARSRKARLLHTRLLIWRVRPPSNPQYPHILFQLVFTRDLRFLSRFTQHFSHLPRPKKLSAHRFLQTTQPANNTLSLPGAFHDPHCLHREPHTRKLGRTKTTGTRPRGKDEPAAATMGGFPVPEEVLWRREEFGAKGGQCAGVP